MSKFRGLRKASSNILKAFSGDVVLKKTTTGKYNLSEGSASETITEVSIKGFLEDVTKFEANGLIMQNDKKLTISRGDITFEPTPADTVLVSGISYNVIQVDKDMVEGEDVIYQLYLRA